MASDALFEFELGGGLALSLSRFVGALLAVQSDSFGSLTDIYVASGEPVVVRQGAGRWRRVVRKDGSPWVFDLEHVRAFVNGIYTGQENQVNAPAWEQVLRRHGSLHPATVLSGEYDGRQVVVRVRCTIQRQSMGSAIGLVLRVLPQSIPTPEILGLPAHFFAQTSALNSGLVVVTGPTGSGKSTTLASLLQMLNDRRSCHILTIEDPIEYEFERHQAIITQREIGVDVPSFSQGVKDALRFVPDVILVGETRDAETMRAVVRAAESGHLVLTSMHTPTTLGALSKMRALLGEGSADIAALAGALRWVVAQELVQDDSGKSVLVYEMMDAGERLVQSYVLSGSPQDAEAVRSKLAVRGLPGALARQDRLRELVRSGRLSAQRAAMMASTREEREEFLRMSSNARTPVTP